MQKENKYERFKNGKSLRYKRMSRFARETCKNVSKPHMKEGVF
jgi:hypothetical protein